MSAIIVPRVLKGFRDMLPSDELLRRETERRLEQSFRLFGFVPIDTPILEYAEILLGKGGGETDKQVYRFRDHGDRDVAMRFDLTVPFARFMALHGNDLPKPFRRYHIGKVYRGENTQRGRYREFTQCDFDIVGADNAAADAEVLLLIRESLTSLGVRRFKVHVGHRGLFNRFLERIGIGPESASVLRTVDKMRKLGEDRVKADLNEVVGEKNAEEILDYVRTQGSFEEKLDRLIALSGGDSPYAKRLRAINELLIEGGTEEQFVLDPSITRGLDYYTGVVFETFVTGSESNGSVCAGGRYNDLASLYTKSSIPGVGASVGVDRLISALSEGSELTGPATTPRVAVLNIDEQLLSHYFRIAARFRGSGISCEVSLTKSKLAQQFARSEKIGAEFAVVCGEEEKSDETVNLKHLPTRTRYDGIRLAEAIETVQRSQNSQSMRSENGDPDGGVEKGA